MSALPSQSNSDLYSLSHFVVMTDSEIHLTMTSGFSTIAGSVLGAYIGLGVPAENLVTSSVMSIPASLSISKMRYPEMDEPVTRGHVTVDRGESKEKQPVRFNLERSKLQS